MTAILPAYVRQPGGGKAGSSLPAGGISGDVLIKTGPLETDLAWSAITSQFALVGATFDGDSNLLLADAYVDIPVPYNCTILSNQIVVQPAGTVQVKVEKATYAAYPAMTLISAAAPIAISAAAKNQNAVLTGWTTALLAGDILRFTLLAGIVSAKKATVSLRVQK